MQLDAIAPQIGTSSYWEWKGWRIHYVKAGTTGPNLVLIHGFGASTDHWRKNIEALSDRYCVWAVDLLGFGRSQKPKIVYSADLWRDQLRDFCAQLVQAPVFIAGNSLGGYAALCFAADCPEWTQGLILLNCAGPFSEDTAVHRPAWQQAVGDLTRNLFKLPGVIEVVSFVLFMRTRNRDRIREILLKVYKDPTAVTDRLIDDIYRPAFDEGALDVFAAVFKQPPGRKLDELLRSLKRPLLLLWGEADPWMTPTKARRFQQFYPEAALEWVDAGHCPHDERPEAVNAAIDDWIGKTMEGSSVSVSSN
ncbi:alpha/beta fold hydrolase [Altericista sp. CCNU0014]|uniref:alpha/beta fold hydrolase n=1 Tax=Altericista sp. CCNU0014 TaxID=3082949 RepID=UPI00384C4941